MDGLCREIGSRGQQRQQQRQAQQPSEAEPPSRILLAPAPAPASTPTAAVVHEGAATQAVVPTVSTPQPTTRSADTVLLSPSEHQPPQQPPPPPPPPQQQGAVVSTTGLAEMAELFRALRSEAKADAAELQAQLESQQAEMDAKLTAALNPSVPEAAVSDEQLATLQTRLEKLNSAALLTEGETAAVEDIVADFVELCLLFKGGVISEDMILNTPGQTFAVALKVHKLVGLSKAIASDAVFARQVKRKII